MAKKNQSLTEKEKYIEDRFREAVRTLRRMPPVKVQGYLSTWPTIIRDQMEIMAMEKEPMRVRPNAQEIQELEDVIFIWVKWLDVEERKLVWARAERVPWKLICAQFGVKRTKAWEMYKHNLGKIAQKLTEKS